MTLFILFLLNILAPAQPYAEAPMLAARVAAGALPPVELRLPDCPAVVAPIESLGRYGGAWRRLARSPGDMGLNTRLGYEPLLRWDTDGAGVVPGIAESWESSDDATWFVFRLRPGMKWSDGEPFTSDDFIFFHEHIAKNPMLTVAHPAWKLSGGRLMEVEAPDPFTLVIRFAAPNPVFPQMLAFRGSQRGMFAPRHYLRQFHADFTDRARLDDQARREGFVSWAARMLDRMDLEKNPELPSVNPFLCAVAFPAPRPVATRNAYYWKVDPQGRQLPYIDQIAYTTVFDSNVLNLKAMQGEVDFQARHINADNYVLFMESRDKAGDPRNRYRVHVERSTSVITMYVNQHSRDDLLRPIFQDRRFRLALSAAIDRQEIIDVCFFGLGEPSNGVTTPYDQFYLEGLEKLHTQYDPALANRLLDEVGLRRGRDGMRRLPDGEPFRQILHIFPSESGSSTDLWLLVVEHFREVGLHFIAKPEDGALSILQLNAGNSDFWAYGSAGIRLDLDGLAPLTAALSHYAPLYGRYHESRGKVGVKPPPQHQRLVDWHQQMKTAATLDERHDIGQRMLREWAEQCYLIGICRKPELTIISNRLRNVPSRIIHDYTLMTPGYLGIEQFWIDDEVDR